MNNIHSQALFVLGLKNRLDKLRKEATELANAVDRFEEGKATFDDVLHEMRDVEFVWRSVEYSQQCFESTDRNLWHLHEAGARKKLMQAIEDMQRFVEEIAGDGDA